MSRYFGGPAWVDMSLNSAVERPSPSRATGARAANMVNAPVIEAPGRNGTGLRLPVKTVDISLDDIGYAGWVVTMRMNPRSSVYDDFLAIDDMPRWWRAFGKMVQAWNFADEDGQPFPLPSEIESERELDLARGVVGFIYRRYMEEFRASIGLPKVPDAGSETSSATSDGPATGE